MQTSNKQTKNVSVVTEINLSKFADQLKDKSEKLKSKKETIYIYPETMSEADKSGEVGKKFRNGLRNKMQRFANDFFAYAKKEEIENVKKLIVSFDEHYAKNYQINDYSVGSISQSKKEAKEKDLNLMFEIIKEFKK